VSRALAVAALVALATPAWAQSKRYPPRLPDPDRDAEQRSKLWEDALAPGKNPYQALVRGAKPLADEHTPDGAKAALDKLDRAVALLPKEPDAYALRGEVEIWQRQWDKCADDFGAAEEHSKPDDGTTPERTARRVSLGVCQSRAGRYAEAERTFVGTTANSGGRASTWLRLGEVRIAMGKLDEAVGALDTALEMCTSGCDAPLGLVHFMLAVAYDRERRPGDAEHEILAGAQFDRSFGQIQAPQYPLLGAGEADYLQGLAHRYEPTPRIEQALVYFRRFLHAAPDSPWKRRAEEHMRELSALDLPLTVDKRAGSAMPDLDAARVSVAKAMPAMRTCLAKLPTTVVEVEITRDGPHTPDTVRDQPRFRTPPPGVSVRDTVELDTTPRDDINAAIRCVQPIAEKIPMPPAKDRDTYYKAVFLVVGS
jgi:tetratricopeptide (TPR) repeat protein